ncbi:unnamed protein product [Cochlearia groenlandica]
MDFTIAAILAATTTSVFIIIFLLLLLLIILTRRRSNKHNPHRPSPNPILAVRSQDLTDVASFDPSISDTQISMEDLSVATKGFSPDLIVGDGSFGFVYRAKLSNGVVVAVKKLDKDALQGFREFSAEVETLVELLHPNIVRILGYCINGRDRVLIYEFLDNGSLDYWLHEAEHDDDISIETDRRALSGQSGQSTDHCAGQSGQSIDHCALSGQSTTRSCALSWPIRVRIAHGVARGLAYLHGLTKPIIHRDIKSSNVLLDSDFVAHIADFGLARMMEDASRSHVSTQVAGTMGYMPPEYWEGNTAATVKADVYSFGVLMLEMATKRRPNWLVLVDDKEVGIAQWAVMLKGQNRYFEMVVGCDEESEKKSVDEYFRIACLCINEAIKERPTMDIVVVLLGELCQMV